VPASDALDDELAGQVLDVVDCARRRHVQGLPPVDALEEIVAVVRPHLVANPDLLQPAAVVVVCSPIERSEMRGRNRRRNDDPGWRFAYPGYLLVISRTRSTFFQSETG
jgi:hypothetical protein